MFSLVWRRARGAMRVHPDGPSFFFFFSFLSFDSRPYRMYGMPFYFVFCFFPSRNKVSWTGVGLGDGRQAWRQPRIT